MQDAPKAVWSIPYVSRAFFPSLKQNFIAYRSSKVSDCISEIHQLWQSGFSRVYSNCCCNCSFEHEIIRIGQSSHKMYSNKILNFQESTPILNVHTKKVWKLIICTSDIYIYIYIYIYEKIFRYEPNFKITFKKFKFWVLTFCCNQIGLSQRRKTKIISIPRGLFSVFSLPATFRCQLLLPISSSLLTVMVILWWDVTDKKAPSLRKRHAHSF